MGYYPTPVTVDTFRQEIRQAMESYDRYVVCIDKTPDEFEATLRSLISKALKAYESRGPHLRHGIALDKFVTVILSQTEHPRPYCGIYFNLHSPYQRHSAVAAPQLRQKAVGGAAEAQDRSQV
jgi:hypothetical protein